MTNPQWTAVDEFLGKTIVQSDDALTSALAASRAAGLPEIAVSAAQGKFLHLLARSIGAKRILEVGTLGGYSTIWLARALAAGGQVVTLELDPKHAEVARGNLEGAGLGKSVEVKVGNAHQTLAQLCADRAEPFDLIFIDADKPSCPEYFVFALRLSRPGSLIVVDNVVRKGAVADLTNTDAAVVGVRRLHELVAAEPRVSATTIQTVGTKGYDGFLFARVEDAV